jgi:hypothetical protein
VSRLHRLPLGDLGGSLILLGAGERTGRNGRGELVPDVLLQHWAHIRFLAEVTLGARIPATAAHVHEEREGLSSRRPFVEVGALAPEGVGRHYRL